jgi:TetR/AcrR family transcriptional regulator, repressor of the ameABC operon
MMATETRQIERRRAAQLVQELFAERGEEIHLADLAASGRIPRRKLEELFDHDDDLFEAVVELWFEPHVAIMEEVVASELPSNRKMYEFFLRRFRVNRERFRRDPVAFAMMCEAGAARFERVRSFVDLADHYLCELIAHAQADGFFPGLGIDQSLSLINQMVSSYTMPESLIYIDERLSEEKLARIIDTIFIGLSAEDGGARGLNTLRLAK